MILVAMMASLTMLPYTLTYDELARTTVSELACVTKLPKGNISFQDVFSKDKSALYKVVLITGETKSDVGIGERFLVKFSDELSATGLLVAKGRNTATVALSQTAIGPIFNNDHGYLRLHSLSGNEPGKGFASVDFAEYGDPWRQSIAQFRDCIDRHDESAAAD